MEEHRNILFQVTTLIDSKCWQEIYWQAIHPRNKILRILSSIIVFGAVLFIAFIFIDFHYSYALSCFMILVAASFIFICCYIGLPWKTGVQKAKEYRRSFGKTCIQQEYTFLDDFFISSCVEKQNRNALQYHQIEWIKETKHYFLLKDRGNSAFCMLDKSCFSIGSADQFRKFVHSKMAS